VIINLLTNAIKYTPSDGDILVRVEHLKDSDEVAVHVKDTGIGIPEDCLEQLFDRFFRVEKKVHTIKGTGLGLTIVKKVIEKHNGRVGVESAIGEGSTFSFYLPPARLDAEQLEETADYQALNSPPALDGGTVESII